MAGGCPLAQRPVAIGLSLCEQVIVDEHTRNVTLVNCFTERAARRFPSEPIPFVVFALLTDGNGQITLDIVIERLDSFEEIQRVSSQVSFSSPLQTVRCTVRLHGCVFPVEGHYRVLLLAGGELIAQRKLAIVAQEEKP